MSLPLPQPIAGDTVDDLILAFHASLAARDAYPTEQAREDAARLAYQRWLDGNLEKRIICDDNRTAVQSVNEVHRNQVAEDLEFRRTASPASVKLARKTPEGAVWVVGLAVPYDQPTDLSGQGDWETFVNGSLDQSVARQRDADGDIRVDIHHNAEKILARSARGSAVFKADDSGVWVRFALPKTTLGADTAEEIRGGLLDGLSIAFARSTVEDRLARRGDRTIREITRADLRAVSLVFAPAYRQTVGKLRIDSDPTATFGGRSQAQIETDRRRKQIMDALVEESARDLRIRGENDKLRRRLDLELLR